MISVMGYGFQGQGLADGFLALLSMSLAQWLLLRRLPMSWTAQLGLITPVKLKHMQLPENKMFDKSGQWIHLETFDEFDNGLSELIDLWSSTAKTATKTVKESALAHFKEDLEATVLKWTDNRAKSKKYASIGKELAEFEEVLKEGSGLAPEAASNAPAARVKAKKKA